MKFKKNSSTPEEEDASLFEQPLSDPESSLASHASEDIDDEYIRRKIRKARRYSLIMILLAAAAVTAAVFLAKDVVPIGVDAFKIAYQDALNRARTAEEDTDAYTHLQTFDIKVGDLHEISELVVLTVGDSEVNIVNTDDNKDGIASWVRMSGYADYTVDMTKAEFVVDTVRGHITVRIPEPELGPVTPDYSGIEQLLCENKGANDNIAVGTSIIEQQSAELKSQIEAALSSNEQNAQFAREEALTVVKNLLIDLNPGLDSANITVEYFS